MIDICDFAVGLSRQLYGLTIATERADHRMMETWHPLGVVGVISAFNFPGRGVVVERGARARLRQRRRLEAVGEDAADRAGRRRRCSSARCSASAMPAAAPDDLLGRPDRRPRGRRGAGRPSARAAGVGDRLDRAWAAPSARGWRSASRARSSSSAATTRRSSAPSADLDLALRAIAFAAMGTAGQRCTTLRRLFVHESVYDALVPRLKRRLRLGRDRRSAARPARWSAR